MKRTALVIVLLAMFVVSCLALTACHSCEFGEWEVAKNATCTQEGIKERFCSCGEKQTTTIPSTGHTEVVDSAVAPDCTGTGLTEGRHCSVCYEVLIPQQTVNATGHTEVVDQAVAPTCTATGLTEGKHCSVCGEVLVAQTVIDALGHDEVAHEAKAPTCTAIGWDAYVTCSRCDYTTYVEKTALGHDLVDVEGKAATCLEAGYTAYKDCSRCDYIEGKATIEALGHDYIPHEAKDPTCTEVGWKAYVTCSRCDYTTYEEIPALGHTEGAVVVENNVAPKCTTDGSYDNVIYCTVCDVELSRDTVVVPATGHTEGAVVVENNVNPTCTVDGSYDNVIYCTVCKAETSRDTVVVDKLGHDEIPHDAQAVTCTEIGWNEYVTCSRCDYTTYAEIPATGHNYNEVVTNPTCLEQGYTTHTCHCGDNYTDTYVEATGHSHNAVITKPTCTEQGYTTHTCHCGDSFVDTYVNALGHDEIEHVAKAPTCTEIGWDAYVTCSRCKYTTYKVISATGHNYVDEVCTLCNCDYYSEGLNYALNGTSYRVTGIGTCTDTDVVIPSIYKGRLVDSVGYYAFSDCRRIKSITIPDSVTSIGNYAFAGCENLVSVTISKGVTLIGERAFIGCYSLVNVTFAEESELISIGYLAFSSCKNLISISLPENLTAIDSLAFYSCTNLPSITIPEGVKSIGDRAFDGCINLIEVCNKSSLSIVAGASSNGKVGYYAKHITKDESDRYVQQLGDYMFYDDGIDVYMFRYFGSDLMPILPDNYNGKEYAIYEYAFYTNRTMRAITIPSSVTRIFPYAFYHCTELSNVTFAEGSSLTILDSYTFCHCTALSSITFAEDSQLRSIASYAIVDGYKLKNINIPSTVTSIGSYAFEYCTSLESITIPNSVISIGEFAFSSCGSLTSITIPRSVNFIGKGAFYGCSNLTSAIFEDLGYSSWVASDGTKLTLTNPSDNALYLTHASCDWYKN